MYEYIRLVVKTASRIIHILLDDFKLISDDFIATCYLRISQISFMFPVYGYFSIVFYRNKFKENKINILNSINGTGLIQEMRNIIFINDSYEDFGAQRYRLSTAR